MFSIEVTSVDERDSNWEDSQPRYRVLLFQRPEPGSDAYSTDAYELVGGDVVQVIDWAQRHAKGIKQYAIGLVSEHVSAGRGIIWLLGRDANDVAMSDLEFDSQRRMELRRRREITVPPSDQAPAEGALETKSSQGPE